MRLLTRRIYRAFPELDRYSDEQCERFIKAARGGRARRTIGGAISAAVAAVFFVGSLIGAAWLIEARFGRFDPLTDGPLWGRFIGLLGFGLLLSPPPLAAFLVRDLLLRRRVRFVLRVRGVCPSCWYSLVGLPVAADHRVQCPECGTTVSVDPSLGELTVDPDGRTRCKPEFTPPDLAGRFWNPSRRRALRRTVLWSLAVVVLVGGGTIGGYEIFLRRQAAAARAGLLGQAGLDALPGRYGVPARVAGGDDPLEIIKQIDAIQEPLMSKWQAATSGRTWATSPLPLLYVNGAGRARFGLPSSPDPADLTAARDYLNGCNAAGVNQLLDRLVAVRGAIEIVAVGGDGGPPMPNMEWTTAVASALPIAVANAKQSLEVNDRAGAARSIEHSLAMLRLLNEAPAPFSVYWTAPQESDVLDRVVESLMPPVTPGWLDTISGVLDRQEATFAPEYHAEVERFWAEQMFASLFSDPERVRLGKYGSQLTPWIGGGAGMPTPMGRLGTYAENMSVIESRFDALSARSKQEPWQRTGSAPTPSAAGPLVLSTRWMFGWSTSMSQDAADVGLLRRRGIRAMIAIERYHAANGAYPTRLADLVPKYLAAEPRDPFTGRSIAYKTIDPATDPFGRGYLLYSIGTDGSDDGGRMYPSDPTYPLRPATGALSTTWDYVINQPPPP